MPNSLNEIANQLVAYCREGKEEQGLNELYAKDAVSVEAAPMPGADSAEMQGLDAIRGKHEWWNNTMEVHSASVDGPYPHGDNRFGVIFEMDTTNKETNERSQLKEMAVYTVDNGKIVREEFFYQN